jgi:hypothetical protein
MDASILNYLFFNLNYLFFKFFNLFFNSKSLNFFLFLLTIKEVYFDSAIMNFKMNDKQKNKSSLRSSVTNRFYTKTNFNTTGNFKQLLNEEESQQNQFREYLFSF